MERMEPEVKRTGIAHRRRSGLRDLVTFDGRASFPSAGEGGQSVGTPAFNTAYLLEFFGVTGLDNR